MGNAKGGGSLATKDASKGGGTEGAIATIAEIGFVEKFTYGGRFKADPNAALYVKYDIEGFKKPWDLNFSLGKSKRFEVVADGDGIRLRDGGTGVLNEGSPAFAFFQAVEEAAQTAGLDITDLLPELDEGGQSIRELEGKRVRLKNVKIKTQGGDEKEYQVIAEFLDEEAPEVITKSTTKKTPDVTQKTADIISGLVDEHKRVKKGDLAVLLNDGYRKDKDIKAMVQLVLKDSFLSQIDGVKFDAKKGVLTPEDNDD